MIGDVGQLARVDLPHGADDRAPEADARQRGPELGADCHDVDFLSLRDGGHPLDEREVSCLEPERGAWDIASPHIIAFVILDVDDGFQEHLHAGGARPADRERQLVDVRRVVEPVGGMQATLL